MPDLYELSFGAVLCYCDMKINRTKLIRVLRIAGLGVCYFFFITLTGIAVPCPLKTVTHGHLLCPGCGVTRMCVSAAHLDLRSAFCWHPVIFCLLPVWAVCLGLWLFDRGKRFCFVVEVVSIVLLLAYFILRNIPGWPLY